MSNPSRGGLRPFQPTRFGRYSLLSLVAKGGMGAVYLARMASVEGFEKFVVIKKILPALAQQQDFVERFVDEAKIVVKLQHGSIAQVLDMGVEDGEYYIAMEFVDGKDLRKVAARMRDIGASMPPALALYVIVRVLDALAFAHRKKDAQEQELNLVHRDISPQNVLVSYEGEVKVIDFGLAKSAASLGRTSPSVVLGKFFYMSPEQARHKNVDRRADLYAAAICLWELLAGHNPFDGVKPFEIMRTVANPSIPSIKSVRPDLSDSLDKALMKGLSIEPDERYPSAEEMRGRLTAVMLEIDPAAGPESLAAFMREQFAHEYESERKAIASLARLSVQEPESSAAPSAEAAKAQAAFKPIEASGLDATAAGFAKKAPEPLVPRATSPASLAAARASSRTEVPASAASRRRTRESLPRHDPEPSSPPTPIAHLAIASGDAESGVEELTPVGRAESEGDGEAFDAPTPVGRRSFPVGDPATPVGLQAQPDAHCQPTARQTAPTVATGRTTRRAQPELARPDNSTLLIVVGIAGLVGAVMLGFVVFKPFDPVAGPQARPVPVEMRSGPLRPSVRPEPPPVLEPVLEPVAVAAPEVVPETLALLRSGKKLSRRELATVFLALQGEIAAMKEIHDCARLGPVCSLSDGMALQYKKMLPDARKHEQLRSLLLQWAEALNQRRQVLAGTGQ